MVRGCSMMARTMLALLLLFSASVADALLVLSASLLLGADITAAGMTSCRRETPSVTNQHEFANQYRVVYRYSLLLLLPLLQDVAFREQFELVPNTERYAAVLEAIPQV